MVAPVLDLPIFVRDNTMNFLQRESARQRSARYLSSSMTTFINFIAALHQEVGQKSMSESWSTSKPYTEYDGWEMVSLMDMEMTKARVIFEEQVEALRTLDVEEVEALKVDDL